MQDLLPWLGPGPVLELGCGNGKLLHPLAAAGLRVVGLDLAWNALRRLDHPDRVLADAATLPFAPASFTAVLDVHCGGHLDPRGRRLAALEAARVVAPGGTVVVERLGRGDLRASQGTAVDQDPHARRLTDGRTTWFADEADLEAQYSQAGLDVIGASTQRRTQRTPAGPLLRETVRVLLRRTP